MFSLNFVLYKIWVVPMYNVKDWEIKSQDFLFEFTILLIIVIHYLYHYWNHSIYWRKIWPQSWVSNLEHAGPMASVLAVKPQWLIPDCNEVLTPGKSCKISATFHKGDSQSSEQRILWAKFIAQSPTHNSSRRDLLLLTWLANNYRYLSLPTYLKFMIPTYKCEDTNQFLV